MCYRSKAKLNSLWKKIIYNNVWYLIHLYFGEDKPKERVSQDDGKADIFFSSPPNPLFLTVLGMLEPIILSNFTIFFK